MEKVHKVNEFICDIPSSKPNRVVSQLLFANQKIFWLRNIDAWQNKLLLFICIYLYGLGFTQQLFITPTLDDLLKKILMTCSEKCVKTHTVIFLNILWLHGKECCRCVWIDSWMSYWLAQLKYFVVLLTS